MLDFNDIDPPQATTPAAERDAVRADLLARLESERSDSAKATRREADRAGLKVVKV